VGDPLGVGVGVEVGLGQPLQNLRGEIWQPAISMRTHSSTANTKAFAGCRLRNERRTFVVAQILLMVESRTSFPPIFLLYR